MRRILCVCAVIVCAGCSAPVYQQILKEKALDNSKIYAVSKGAVHTAVLKAFLSKSFVIEKDEADKSFILAKRPFQRGRKMIVMLVQAKIMDDSDSKTILYLNAFQTTERCYVSDRTRFLLWVILLPGGGGKQASTVKEEECLIQDQKFYHSFFDLVDDQVALLQKEGTAPAVVESAPAIDKPAQSAQP